MMVIGKEWVKKIIPIKYNPFLPQPNNFIIEVSFKTLRWGKKC
jgi:hypothetical protein